MKQAEDIENQEVNGELMADAINSLSDRHKYPMGRTTRGKVWRIFQHGRAYVKNLGEAGDWHLTTVQHYRRHLYETVIVWPKKQ